MTNLSDFSIKVKNFKCFGEEPQGFETIRPVNLIIGRNNSGKSSLLDIIEYATRDKIEISEGLWHARQKAEFIAESLISSDQVRTVFPETHSGGPIPGNHYQFGSRLIGSSIKWRLDAGRGNRFVELGPNPEGHKPLDGISRARHNYEQGLANALSNPFAGKEFRRIFAERNIAPEGDSETSLKINGDGGGCTNVIQNFINKANLPSDLVERTLLDDLNHIFTPDGFFTDIVCQQLKGGAWEVYLEEESKGRVPLSQSGSGLKTIILVLTYFHLLPAVAKKSLSSFIFGFEELENNLHPSLLRRLLSYIRKKGEQESCLFFLTTHSNVAIDLFGKDKNSQILHVTHDGTRALVRTTKTYIDNRGILDDLDVRASDLLQSNGIIWIEGPSDRAYLNRWISLWSNGELTEGSHYQCVFYGGRLLSHLSSDDPDTVDEAVSILRTNRHAVLIMDSDKRNQQAKLSDTKRRIIEEVGSMGGMAWVTKGKEIENYIPADAIRRWLNLRPEQIAQVGQYDDFFDYLDKISNGSGRRYKGQKPLLAEQLLPYMDREGTSSVLDLAEKLEGICNCIRRWNGVREFER